MNILGVNEIGFQEPIKVDNNGHLIVSGTSGGGSSSAVIPPVETTGNISGVGVFGKTAGKSNYSPLNIDGSGHLLVSSSGDNNVMLIQGNDGIGNKNVLTDSTGQIFTKNAVLEAAVDATGAGGSKVKVLNYGVTDLDAFIPQRAADAAGNVGTSDINLAATGVKNSATASHIAIQGFFDNQSGAKTFKSLLCNTTGQLQVDVVNGGGGETYTETNFLTNLTLASQGITTTLDLGTVSCKELRVFFYADSGFIDFYACGSNNNVDYYPLFPTNGNPTDLMYAFSTTSNSHPPSNGAYTGTFKGYVQYVFAHPPKYIFFRNNDAAAITGLNAKYVVIRG